MSRWKELPAGLHPEIRQLIVRLRRLKDRGELSTRQLAVKTGYSTRSWERYLSGTSLPPRDAVEAVARVGGDDPARLLVLHEIAAERWAEGDAAAAGTAPGTPPAPEHEPAVRQPYGRSLRVAVTAGAAALVLSVSAVLALAVELAEARAAADAARAGTVAAATDTTVPDPASLLPALYTCRPERTGDRWYAGHSRTRETVVAYGARGPEVIEAQCLMRRTGVSPGNVDGIFGPLTQRAVKRLQDREGLVVDGIIGPDTWQALRGAAPK
ncbi:peptidoglycan-binding protein [Streptomyces sp. CHD11]|uniref:peptidoglycan-binding protein n=1 Tax=Streptomyces sp. CHD11 TaxID=2741325 RepID=UPI001BFC3423|nr:peptidoglycan-binding protein [Streptomyces sp. CHD11]MBT3149783.1 peptidoglycan-binding protein [Streptomyces sp. CHD11]